MTATGGTTFTTTVRVIDRIHGNAANCRAYASPAFGAGLAELAQVMFAVSNLANCCPAIDVNLSRFARAQPNRYVNAFTCG
jgi:hypothetical protein